MTRLGRALRDGLLGKARAQFHGLGPKGEHPSRGYISKTVTRWGLLADNTTQLDGRRVHLIFENCLPVIFRTRREARAYAEKRFGYIRTRPDLLREPHNCRVPRAVRITVSAE